MNEESNERTERTPAPAVPLGIATILPPMAVSRLVRAAKEATALHEGSLERVRIINRAIQNVRAENPGKIRL